MLPLLKSACEQYSQIISEKQVPVNVSQFWPFLDMNHLLSPCIDLPSTLLSNNLEVRCFHVTRNWGLTCLLWQAKKKKKVVLFVIHFLFATTSHYYTDTHSFTSFIILLRSIPLQSNPRKDCICVFIRLEICYKSGNHMLGHIQLSCLSTWPFFLFYERVCFSTHVHLPCFIILLFLKWILALCGCWLGST